MGKTITVSLINGALFTGLAISVEQGLIYWGLALFIQAIISYILGSI